MGTSRLSRAVRFYWDAKTINSIHSPLFFALIRHITDFNKHYYDDYNIEQAREKLLKDNRKITFKDLGAGTKASKSKGITALTVREIAKSSTSNKYKCKLLRNLVSFFKPKYIIEFGTNLGIATAYMHAAARSSELRTVEGIKDIQEIAEEVFTSLAYRDIVSIGMSFKDYLREAKDDLSRAEFIYLDGDHQYQSTLNNFKAVWGLGNQLKVVVLDDINWSAGMAKAWEEIKQLPGVSTLDIYKMGIVIRDEKLTTTTHVKYVPRFLKPFSFGFFG